MIVIFYLLWLLLPAGCANIAALIFSKLLPTLDHPADMGKTFRGKRIFGSHKTIRGLVGGTIVGGIVYILQLYFLGRYPELLPITLPATIWYTGFLMGFGAILGDMIKSFFKRQIGIAPGKSWIPFDQTDWIIGSLLLSMPLTGIPFVWVFYATCVGFFLSILVKYVGYLLGIDDKAI